MSLPPGFLDELRNRISLSDVVGRKVMWDKRKSQPGKGDLWAPCPFHHEKTASFHVDDRKGFYYCFGCHEKGDAFSFVQKLDNVGFMEAIEILATEAGMEMPAKDPKAQEKLDRRTVLGEVMEQAVQFFRFSLKQQVASDARAYLAKRGMTPPVLDRFEIGFAPPGWDNLRLALTGKGVSIDDLVACGLSKKSDKGKEPYDVFRNRIIFPIRDARGRAIAFGGRAMDPDDNAKYLNSPETELFDKSRNLYNLRPAREASGRGQPLVVAEGYMDVIALSEAGFRASVAPLGTAVTESQLQLMWRLSEEPVIALDGDKAGLRAAYRVIDLALPLLEAGKSLRFALMPEGKDPDDLLRAEGAEAVSRVLDAAVPMVELLWRNETEGKTFDSPERRAALDKALRERVRLIRDPSLRQHYGEAIRERLDQLYNRVGTRAPDSFDSGFGGAPGGGYGGNFDRGYGGGAKGEFRGDFKGGFKGRGGRGPRRPWNAPEPPSPTAKASLLASGGETPELRLREEVILATLFCHPALSETFEHQLEALSFADPDLATLRDILLTCLDRPDAVAEEAERRIGPQSLESLLSARHIAVVPCIRTPGALDLARTTVAEELAKLEALRGWQAELQEAVEDLDEGSETTTWRLGQAARAKSEIGRRTDESEMDYAVAKNGALVDKDERSAFDSLLSTIRFEKGRR
ncbi:DNA primase [Sagittula salina]|uniref:DNA primase n=1 Tax=Sagittula salina TaxID=2820268 RepID=A0A940MSM0_9RHOB|nr:DNA primase [Sagittula salina]MBP0484066.1 DNA primase [Sagittula salina]